MLIDGKDEHKSQIDLIIIAASGIYVVEVKTFSDAKIYGDGRKRDWQYYLGGHRYDFYNPIMQNKNHVEYLKKMLSDFYTPFHASIEEALGTEGRFAGERIL